MLRRPATAVLPSARGVARLLAVLLTFAVLFAASPLPLLGAAVTAAPVGEETDTDVESVSSACPRRAAGASGPPFVSHPPARLVPHRTHAGAGRSILVLTSGHVGRGPLGPHPRC